MNKKSEKIVYLHFAGKLPRDYPGKAIMSVALCADFHGTNLITSTVEAVDAETDNNKWIDIQAFDYALDYIYKMQSEFLKHNIVKVFLTTDSKTLHSYLSVDNLNKVVQKDIRAWLKDIYSSHASFMTKEIGHVGVGLADVTSHNRAKNYYQPKYVENPEMFNKTPVVKKMHRIELDDMSNLSFGSAVIEAVAQEEESKPEKKARKSTKKKSNSHKESED